MKSPLSYQARRELVELMAPQYRAASRSQKMPLLDTFVALTGYVRTYAMWLLNHPVESRPRGPQARLPHYGPEVQQALLLAWKAANQICSKRLIPFLPTLVEALERQGHLHLSEECRHQLLSISATTADRLLRGSRQQHPHSVSTTRAGTLLKHQIPIRTFQDWNETQPGLTSSRSGRPLRHTDRGRLPLHGFRSPTLRRAGPNASRFSTAVRKRCWQPSNRHERSFLSPFWVSIPITVVSSSMRKCSRTVSKNR
jgi:hypothetical protein